MNAFVLSTGRCGSTTFERACRHITNYTAGHETRARFIGEERLNYPANHIEADNRLSWFLGRLNEKYGDEAFYVHLVRNEEGTAQSFTNRFRPCGIVSAYYDGVLMRLGNKHEETPQNAEVRLSIARDYCRTVNTNIGLFLNDKSRKMVIHLEMVETEFPIFWESIGAEGDLSAALAEWRVSHNASQPPKVKREPIILKRIGNRVKRVYQAARYGR